MKRTGSVSRITLACLLAATAAMPIGPVLGGPEGDADGMPVVLHLAEGGTSPPASLSSVAWIAGSYRGEALGGVAEEIWSAPDGGAMMGVFRLVREGRVAFYEILTLVEHEGSLLVRLKHFNADLTGWEEKDEVRSFPLVRLEEGAAYFDGLTFLRQAERMTVAVASRAKDGPERTLVFRYSRM